MSYYDDLENNELRQAIADAMMCFSGEQLSGGQINDFIEAFNLNGLEIRLVEDADESESARLDTAAAPSEEEEVNREYKSFGRGEGSAIALVDESPFMPEK